MDVTLSPAFALTYPSTETSSARHSEGQAAPQSNVQAQAQQQQQQQQNTQLIAELQATDRDVRAHEAAHLAAAGGLAMTGAEFTYETGPDGQRYAVGGEVSIDVSHGQTPEETLTKAEQIARAALAPAEPSPQDLAVAAMASQMAAQARQEIAQQQLTAYQDQDPNRQPSLDIFA